MVVRHQQDLGGGRGERGGGTAGMIPRLLTGVKKGDGVTLNKMGDWKRQE